MTAYPKTVKKTQNILEYASDKSVGCVYSAKGITPFDGVGSFDLDVDVALPEKAFATYYHPVDKRYYIGAANGLYQSDDAAAFQRVYNVTGNSLPIMEDYVNSNLSAAFLCKRRICFKSKNLDKDGSRPNEYDVADAVMHKGRVFTIDREGYVVRWSAAGTYEWTKGLYGCGEILLGSENGTLLRVKSLGEQLVILRERGITVLTAATMPENNKVYDLDYRFADANKDTAEIVDGKLLFWTNSGLLSYDGQKLERKPFNLEKHITEVRCAKEFGGRYYLSCKTDLYENGVIIIYDAKSGENLLINYPANIFIAAEKMYFYYGQQGFVFEKELANFEWESEKFDFGTKGLKCLKYLNLECSGEVDLEVSNGNITAFFKNLASGRHKIKLSGREFKIAVKGSGKVSKLEACAEVLNGI